MISFNSKVNQAKKAIYNYLKERKLTWNSLPATPLFCGWSEKRIAQRTVQQILKAYQIRKTSIQ